MLTDQPPVEIAATARASRADDQAEGHTVTTPSANDPRQAAIRGLIRAKLQDARLPIAGAQSVRGSPGDGATCDACGEIITANQMMIKVGPYPGDKTSLCLHADCFELWNAERQPRKSKLPQQ